MKLLIIEDEEPIRESIRAYLTAEGYLCEECATFTDASEKIGLYDYDVILADITLPGGSGLNLVRQAKSANPQTGIIILSARNSLDDKVIGLDLGADDYITKPFHLAELNSRIRALVRRRYYHGSEEIEVGFLRINPAERKLYVKTRQVDLTRKEFDLILFLASNPNRVLTKETIAEHLLGDHADLMDNFDFIYTHMNNLRRKLSCHGIPVPILTIYGIGYKFDTHEASE